MREYAQNTWLNQLLQSFNLPSMGCLQMSVVFLDTKISEHIGVNWLRKVRLKGWGCGSRNSNRMKLFYTTWNAHKLPVLKSIAQICHGISKPDSTLKDVWEDLICHCGENFIFAPIHLDGWMEPIEGNECIRIIPHLYEMNMQALCYRLSCVHQRFIGWNPNP